MKLTSENRTLTADPTRDRLELALHNYKGDLLDITVQDHGQTDDSGAAGATKIISSGGYAPVENVPDGEYSFVAMVSTAMPWVWGSGPGTEKVGRQIVFYGEADAVVEEGMMRITSIDLPDWEAD